MGNVELKRKVTLKRKGGESNVSQAKSKWWLWLLILVAVAVVIIFCVKNYLSNSNNSNEIDLKSETTEQPVTTQTEALQDTDAKKTTVEPEPTAAPGEATVDTTAKVSTPPEDVKPDENKTSPLPRGSLEEKAKQVIRGKFGNGAERKLNLGSEYNAIQQRVNKMYRDGKVK